MRFTQLSALIAAAALSVGSVSAFLPSPFRTDTVGRKVTIDLPAKRGVGLLLPRPTWPSAV